MQTYSLSFLFLLVMAGCTSTPTTTETPPPWTNVPPPQTMPGETPQPITNLPPDATIKSPTPEPPYKAKVTLVLGGAGVASFATVGVLKRFAQEGIEVESILSTGWPGIFAVGYGFSKSVHDLEWFAMHIQKDELSASTFIPMGRTYAAQSKMMNFLTKSFPQGDLSETKIPVYLGIGNVEPGGNRVIDRGEWIDPLVNSIAMPGISQSKLRKENRAWFENIHALNVDEAFRRGAKVVVAVSMYQDYFDRSEKDSEVLPGYIKKMRESVDTELNFTKYTGKIVLRGAALDFSLRRKAIIDGYREAGKIIKKLRENNFH